MYVRPFGGIAELGGTAYQPERLEMMKRAMSGTESRSAWKANIYRRVGIVCRELDGIYEYKKRENERIALVFDGKIEEREKLCATLTLDDCPDDGGLIIAAYSLLGENFLSHVKGRLALALYDEARGYMTVAVKGEGLVLFYSLVEDSLVFSTSISGLCGARGGPLYDVLDTVKVLTDGTALNASFGRCERVSF